MSNGLRRVLTIAWLVGVVVAILILLSSSAPPASQIAASPTAAHIEAAQNTVNVVLKDKNGAEVGQVTLTQGDKVTVAVQVHGLPAGYHGFHIHAVGICDPSGTSPFASAGGHWAGEGQPSHPNHGGDLPSLLVNSDGVGQMREDTARFKLADLLTNKDGSAVIVHAGPDNFANIPTRYAATQDADTLRTGDSGGRIACGVIVAGTAGAVATAAATTAATASH
jgi:superoxide dismutase, Cu-Zn family